MRNLEDKADKKNFMVDSIMIGPLRTHGTGLSVRYYQPKPVRNRDSTFHFNLQKETNMSEFTRRTSLKLIGGSTAMLGMGFPQNAWARENVATAKTVPGKSMETDVAVIGGGCAGMAAAVAAADMGMKVAVFEKQAQLAENGNGPFAGENAAEYIKQQG